MKNLLLINLIILVTLILCSCGGKPTEIDFGRVTTPTFSLAAGVYYANQTVSIACATPNAQIYYTTDGSEPTSSSALYSTPIDITAVTTLKAKAYKSHISPSATASADYIIEPFTEVASPSFSPQAGTYSSGQMVVLSCSTHGAKIYYTSDGSNPGISSLLYIEPILLTSSVELKAIAVIDGLGSSSIETATYVINNLQTASAPVFSVAGGTYSSTQSVSISTSTSGAQIRFTLDNSDPTQYSPLYSSPISISSSVTLKARAFTAGWNPSIIETATYIINQYPTVDTPQFSHHAGVYNVQQSVSITCTTTDAQIRYTTNGSDPTLSSSVYTGPISIVTTTTVKARAYKDGMTASSIASAIYTIITVQVPTPQFSPAAGVYYLPQLVSINCSNKEAQIRYTTDGSDPTISSLLYSVPINVQTSMIIKARAYKLGLEESSINSANYQIIILTVAAPQFTHQSGVYYLSQTVGIKCATLKAQIYYTLDGTDPTSSSKLYSAPLSIGSSTTLKAMATKADMTPSPISTAIYTVISPPTNMVYVPGGTFNMGSLGYLDQQPINRVSLSAFYIAKHEVTQVEWETVMGSNPSYFTGNPNKPVDRVSWFSSLVFCNKRSILEGFTPCYSYLDYGTNPDNWPTGWNSGTGNNFECNWEANGYRLPTEAEWEFAARSAIDISENSDNAYSGSNDINSVAWYNSNSNNATHVCGLKDPNTLGLFDMSGNVYEWCWDWYGPYPTILESDPPLINPKGPLNGTDRICRGGSWLRASNFCLVRYRASFDPPVSSYDVGLRVCRSEQ